MAEPAMAEYVLGHFRDIRLYRRGGRILQNMCKRCSTTARKLGDTLNDQAAVRRFFRNPRVTVSEIVRTAAQRTAEAARARHVLVVEDTSEINYQDKAGRKHDLGTVGNGTDLGLFVHPALALDAADGTVLGLAAATIWRRTGAKDPHYQSLPIEAKESHRWIATAMAARKALAANAASITVITDREGDIYELFARVPAARAGRARTDILVRATHDRALAASEDQPGRLFAAIAAQAEAGRLGFDLTAREVANKVARTARRVALAVRFGQVCLRQPRKGIDPRDPKSLTVTIVEASEIDPPTGEKPIVWRLITTRAVTSLADAIAVVDHYRLRWTIEQLFRTLKSQGLDLEESLLKDGEALEKLAASALVAATQVMQLVQGRGEGGRHVPATLVFSPQMLVVLAVLCARLEGRTAKSRNPHPADSLAWAAWVIARLGGWTGYASERPPGPITMMDGLKRFEGIADGYALALHGAEGS